MHDPSTVAFTIPSPFARKSSFGKYRPPLVTIWHEDPCDFAGKERGRSDDSCGWHTPLMAEGDRERWRKQSDWQYKEIFEKTVKTREGADYARVCYDAPDCYTAVYWIWRAIKHEHRKGSWLYRQPWQYGNRPTAGELEAIMNLATNPVDNLQFCFQHEAATDEDTFWRFYSSVHRAYRRHHRPWYKHPRWHVWHWRLQIHPWQTFRRWAFSRCAGCGGRFAWGECPTSFGWGSSKPTKWFRSEVGSYHGGCAGKAHALMKTPPQGMA